MLPCVGDEVERYLFQVELNVPGDRVRDQFAVLAPGSRITAALMLLLALARARHHSRSGLTLTLERHEPTFAPKVGISTAVEGRGRGL
jgi:hypothetical protein